MCDMINKKLKTTEDVTEMEDGVKMRITLDEVLKEKGLTRYQLAKKKLNQQPNSMTPWGKPGFDPKLSSVIRLAKILDCDINDLFEADGYVSSIDKLANKCGCSVDDLFDVAQSVLSKEDESK
jgi:DNA-binding XRE family transcriptional regulator